MLGACRLLLLFEMTFSYRFFTCLSRVTVDEYSSLKVPLTLYFRNVNQSDPIIQQEMRDYIQAMSDLQQVRQPPDFCWVRDLYSYMTGEATKDMDEDEARQAATIAAAIQSENRTFTEQLDMILNVPTIRDVYGSDIVRDDDGNIKASRCYLFVRHIDLQSIHDQTTLLFDQRQVTAMNQPQISAGANDLSFFSFDELFYYWELVCQISNVMVIGAVSSHL